MSVKCVYLDSDGATEINGVEFQVLVAGYISTKKIAVQNRKTTATGSISLTMGAKDANSTMHQYIAWRICPETLSCPSSLLATLAPSGTLTVGEEYFYRLTTLAPSGESAGSLEVSVIPTSGQQAVDLAWDEIPGATGYKVYRSINQDYTGDALLVTLGPTGAWRDDGGYAPSGAMSTENTTAGQAPYYGTAPVTGWTPSPSGIPADTLELGSLKSGEQKFIWLKAIPPVTAEENLNDGFAITPYEGA